MHTFVQTCAGLFLVCTLLYKSVHAKNRPAHFFTEVSIPKTGLHTMTAGVATIGAPLVGAPSFRFWHNVTVLSSRKTGRIFGLETRMGRYGVGKKATVGGAPRNPDSWGCT